ncbi:hypothetical protein AGMMS50229_04210 [Campylobacterota bacterium]|nr:hypothetical protein AGMMS50229_04210 [Campylobacterota bacterium]
MAVEQNMYRFLALRIADGLHKVSVPNWAYHPVMLFAANADRVRQAINAACY